MNLHAVAAADLYADAAYQQEDYDLQRAPSIWEFRQSCFHRGSSQGLCLRFRRMAFSTNWAASPKVGVESAPETYWRRLPGGTIVLQHQAKVGETWAFSDAKTTQVTEAARGASRELPAGRLEIETSSELALRDPEAEELLDLARGAACSGLFLREAWAAGDSAQI